MTAFEAKIDQAKRQMLLNAIKSNQYANDFPDRADKCASDAKWYAGWLQKTGVSVDLDTDGNKISRVTINGKLLVDGGCLVR